MAASPASLQILDKSSAAKELDLASELFHRINRVIPQDQTVLTISAEPPSFPRRCCTYAKARLFADPRGTR